MDMERLRAELSTQTERADYAWRNAQLIDKARMEDRARFEGLAERCQRLEAIVRDFLALYDWHDAAIAPAELIERSRAAVGNDRGQRGAACGASAAPTGCASNGNYEERTDK